MLDERIHEFLQNAGPIFFVAPAAGRAIGLEKELPDFHIVCSQKTNDIKLLQDAGVQVFCLEKDIKNSGKLLMNSEVLDYIKCNSAGKKANIITFKPSPMIEMICRRNGFRYLGNNSKINRTWEDKVKFARITTQLGIQNANSRIIRIEKDALDVMRYSLDFSENRKYVVQFPHGYSGNSTFLVKAPKELGELLKDNSGKKAKIADYKEGETYTFDVCLGDFGTISSQPIFQITGFSELNKNYLGTCGNDYAYGKNLSEDVKDSIEMSIEKVTGELSRVGYKGILGFDFVVSDNEAHLIEVNARLVGSIPVFTKLQLAAGEIPFLLLHILSFLEFDFRNFKVEKTSKSFDFSHVILRNVCDRPMKIEKALPSGIYKFGPDGIVLRKETYFAEGSIMQDEFFLGCAAEGETIDPDMEYANIQFSYGIMNTKDSFKEEFEKIKGEIFKNIILK